MSEKPSGLSLKVALASVFILLALTGAGFLGYGYYYSSRFSEVRNLVIEDQPLQIAMNGPHFGAYSYGGFVYEVEVTIMYHEIVDIKIISNRSSRYARRAEAVVDRVMSKGNVNVEAVSGATVTSKALLKAIELAISGSC